MKYFILAAAILSNLLTNVGFKFASQAEGNPTKKWSLFAGALVFGLINSVLFTESLKYLPLQVVSAIFFSLTLVGLFLISHFYFGEPVTVYRLSGAVLIIAGVIVISIG